MRRPYALLVVLAGCGDGVSFGGDSVSISDRELVPQAGFVDTRPALSPLEAPDAAPPQFPQALSASACDTDAEAFARIYGACPDQPPGIESCTLEGVQCLYPSAPSANGADGGTEADACYAIFGCSLGLWSPLGERCPGPLQWNPVPIDRPVPVPLEPVPPMPSSSIPATGSAPEMSSVPVVASSSAPEDAGLNSDAGFGADTDVTLDAGSATQADAALDAGVDASQEFLGDAGPSSSLLDASSAPSVGSTSDAPVAPSAPEAGTADAGSQTSSEGSETPALPDCPRLSPVPGSACTVDQACGYGSCSNQMPALRAECICGHWIERTTDCGAVGR